MYTHFATADDPEPALFNDQRERFEEALAVMKELQPGAEPVPQAQILRTQRQRGAAARFARWYDLVRPGLLLYGIVRRRSRRRYR